MKFDCSVCGKEHEECLAFGADRPDQYWDVPEDKRDADVFLTSDTCVIADRFFFVRGCLDIPIVDSNDSFTWGVWTSLSEDNFFLFQDHYEVTRRDHIGPFFGWLCTRIPVYSDTLNLKTMVHLRNDGIRPFVKLEPTDHPLSIEQSQGITSKRLREILAFMEHGEERESG